MRSIFGLLTVIVACAACASSGASGTPSSSRPATETVRIDGAPVLNTTASGPSTSSRTLAFPIDRAWSVLPAVYDSLGIPITTADATTHTIGNAGYKVRFRLGKVSLSRYLDCGDTQMGPSADSYEVFLTIYTKLTTAGGNATGVETSLEASARPVQFSQPPSRCSSKGALEPRVADVLTKVLSASAH